MHFSDVLSELAYGKIGMFMEAAFSNCKSSFFFTLQRKVEKKVFFTQRKRGKDLKLFPVVRQLNNSRHLMHT